jgi:hypothetical protein
MRLTAESRPSSESTELARRKLDDLADSQGVQGLEYAGALNHLALLLIMQGDAASAEPLLRQALQVRREALGENHPDYATSLSSLGGLLWSRGELDEAEPLLRRAAEIRLAWLGPAHPKTVVSLNSLDHFLKARLKTSRPLEPARLPPPDADAATAHLLDRLRPEASASAIHSLAATLTAERSTALPSAEALSARLETLGRDFRDLAPIMEAAAQGLWTENMPPPEALAAACFRASAEFAQLSGGFRSSLVDHGIQVPESEFRDLDSLRSLLPLLEAAESARREIEASKTCALNVLSRVGRLRSSDASDFKLLLISRNRAGAIAGAIQSSALGVAPSEVASLARGDHPLCALVNLASADVDVSDEQWADWFSATADGLDAGLAVAAGRGRFSEDAAV